MSIRMMMLLNRIGFVAKLNDGKVKLGVEHGI